MRRTKQTKKRNISIVVVALLLIGSVAYFGQSSEELPDAEVRPVRSENIMEQVY